MLELTAAILAEHRLAAAQVRDRYRYFLVDTTPTDAIGVFQAGTVTLTFDQTWNTVTA